jgi:hypothetical protein
VGDERGIDAPRVDAEAGHRHERRHAAVDKVTALSALDQDTGLKPPTAGERTSTAEELHVHGAHFPALTTVHLTALI